jgi:hypothetical protein
MGAGATGGRAPQTGGSTVVVIDDDAGVDNAIRCDDMRIASIGAVARYGDNQNDDTDAFVSWLNEKSSAKVDLLTRQQPLTFDLLSGYNVIIIQDLLGWSFGDDELHTFSAWVGELGGGVIALSGYDTDAAEVVPTNALIAFAGVSYNRDDTLYECPNECCYCTGGSVPTTGWNLAHPITEHIQAVGSFHGRSITVSNSDAVIVAEMGGLPLATAVEKGEGRLFAFHDEWVTYTSQWRDSGRHSDCNSDPNHSCYGTTADQIFQTSQFWYNVIKWVSQCEDFVITDPEIIY